MFDPYHKWLGIPKGERPPTLYQLLGISPSETDVEVIDESAIRQTAHVRTYQIGPHAKECTQILGEIALARITLLNPAKRKEYDAELAKKMADNQSRREATQVAAGGEFTLPSSQSTPFADLEGEDSLRLPRRSGDKKKAARSPALRGSASARGVLLTRPMLYGIIGGGVGLVLVIVLVLVVALGGRRRQVNPVLVQKEDSKGMNDSAFEPDPEKQDKNSPPPIKSNSIPIPENKDIKPDPLPEVKRDPPPEVKKDPLPDPLKSLGLFAKHFINPDGDCRLLDTNEKEGSLTFNLPGTNHDLCPTKVTNGPRVLVDVDGDFTLEARIQGNLVPAANAELPGTKSSYRSGCLLLWYDDANFILFERGVWGIRNTAGNQVNLAGYKNGKADFVMPTPSRNEATSLRIQRTGNSIVASYEGGNEKRISLNAPSKMKVGVGAINVSSEPLQVTFDRLKLTLAQERER